MIKFMHSSLGNPYILLFNHLVIGWDTHCIVWAIDNKPLMFMIFLGAINIAWIKVPVVD